MRPVVLIRETLSEQSEIEAAKKYFPVIHQRTQVQKGDLVIPRYSALPFYKEFEADVNYIGGKLINTFGEHRYAADLKAWYGDLCEHTPKTWFDMQCLPEEGPFVLKGETSSKKFQWNTHMFAKNKKEAMHVHGLLGEDGYVGYQPIVARQYVPLRKLAQGFQGLPISEEYRYFILDGKVLTGAFYWSEHYDVIDEKDRDISQVPTEWLEEVIYLVSDRIRFFVLDIARTEDGHWIVIEVNDGQQSGLSMNDPDILYSRLFEALKV